MQNCENTYEWKTHLSAFDADNSVQTPSRIIEKGDANS